MGEELAEHVGTGGRRRLARQRPPDGQYARKRHQPASQEDDPAQVAPNAARVAPPRRIGKRLARISRNGVAATPRRREKRRGCAPPPIPSAASSSWPARSRYCRVPTPPGRSANRGRPSPTTAGWTGVPGGARGRSGSGGLAHGDSTMCGARQRVQGAPLVTKRASAGMGVIARRGTGRAHSPQQDLDGDGRSLMQAMTPKTESAAPKSNEAPRRAGASAPFSHSSSSSPGGSRSPCWPFPSRFGRSPARWAS